MWHIKLCKIGEPHKFFSLSLARDSLEDHYTTNFALMQHHKYSLTELNDMIPWEREIYVSLLANFIKEENEKLRQKMAERRHHG